MSHFYVYVIILDLNQSCVFYKPKVALLHIFQIYNICDCVGEKRQLIYSKLLIEYQPYVSSTVTGVLYKISVFHFYSKVILGDNHVSFIIKKAISLPRIYQLVQHLKVSLHLWYKCYMSSPGDEQLPSPQQVEFNRTQRTKYLTSSCLEADQELKQGLA